jgi:hypothetical protein
MRNLVSCVETLHLEAARGILLRLQKMAWTAGVSRVRKKD